METACAGVCRRKVNIPVRSWIEIDCACRAHILCIPSSSSYNSPCTYVFYYSFDTQALGKTVFCSKIGGGIVQGEPLQDIKVRQSVSSPHVVKVVVLPRNPAAHVKLILPNEAKDLPGNQYSKSFSEFPE